MAEKNEVLTEDDDKDVEYVIRDEPEEVEKPKVVEEVEDDDDEDDDDSRMVNADPDDDDRELIRERRRQEKKERKERREKAITRDKTELNFLRDRNDELERRMMAIESNISKSHLDTVDQRIRQAVNKVEAAEQVIAKAIEAGNGEDVTKAMRYRDQAVNEVRQLQHTKAEQEQKITQPQQPKVDNEVVYHAKEFVKDHPWYDPQGNNEESAVVLAIDNRMAQEGYDPRSPDYWNELRNRVKRRLPEKFESPRRKAVGGPALGGSSENAAGRTNRREVYISPERKAALMEAGVWDDPVLRQRYIKRYMEYDRNNKG
jgi:hypothetical protein